MDKLTKQDGKSLDVVNENLEALKAIFPEALTEDGVDFEVLRQLLGDAVDEGEEKYGLTWHGKKKARQIALMPSLGTLRPCPEESVDWNTTQNLFIEGDNLEVLKLLQKSYANKIKMIYIDPPFNTGNEFIYPDKFQDNLDIYLKYTGQKDDEGFKISSNTESSGRYHTNWLNMMYPRLKLANRLLKREGVIFISIGGEELSNLIAIMNELFGEECYKNIIVIRRGMKNVQAQFETIDSLNHGHEYVVFYAKNGDTRFQKFFIKHDQNEEATGSWNNHWRGTDRPTMRYEIFGIEPSSGQWRWGKERSLTAIENWKRLTHDLGKTPTINQIDRWVEQESSRVNNKIDLLRLSRNGKPEHYVPISEGKLASDLWTDLKPNGGQQLKKTMGDKYFDTPKSIDLLERMINFSCKTSEIILDFFAGSGTTAEAVLRLNNEDDGNRKFIMVQLPEPCDEKSEAYKAGFKSIAGIGKERIRRAAAKTKEENPEYEGDLGFKVFKLDSSNIRAWNPDRNDLEQTLIDHMEHLVEGRSEEDVLYELLLKRGVDLTIPIEEKTITGKTVYSIGYGVLFACLDTVISREEVEDLAHGIIDWHKELEPASDTQVVFRDSAFANDIAKTNMTAILEQHGIAHVRSL